MTLPGGKPFHLNDLANTLIYFSSILDIKVYFDAAFCLAQHKNESVLLQMTQQLFADT